MAVADLQARLTALTLSPEKFEETLPEPVKAKVEELTQLQAKYDDLYEQFRKEKLELEKKYQGMYRPLLDQRASVLSSGDGIPDFWLTVLLRLDLTREMMNEKDIDVLRYLRDIKCDNLEPTTNEDGETSIGFKLTFVFAENPYFTNKELTKTYHMLEDDEPVLEKAEGCEIDWQAGKNVTVKLMKKKPKKGAPASAKPQTKTEPVQSFFNFFSPPEVPSDEAEFEDEEEMEALHEAIENDFDIGAMLRGKLIPNAVEWFTGEALEDEEDDFDDEDEDFDEDDEDEGEVEDEDEDSPRPAKAKKGKGPKAAGAAGEQPQECKQQ